MKKCIKKVVIVGGGTSGWMSASYIKKKLPEVEITVFESPTVRRIGVGEATLPNLQTAFWDVIGIPEEVWMKRVGATFKTGIKFINWKTNPTKEADYFYHHFGILPNCDSIPLSHYWAYDKIVQKKNKRFDYCCYSESTLADNMRSPKMSNNEKTTNYAWHFDANLVAEYLKEISLDLGVKLIPEHIENASLDENGHINTIKSDQGTEVSGDLFIDCTGFRSVLIEKIMKEPFVDMGDALSCNSAIATQVPVNNEIHGLKPYTTATALSSGWSWNIPLLGRNGLGYVFSDNFCSHDKAILEFSKHLKIDPDKQEWNKIRFRVGMRKRSWVKNCVAIGLSSNFLEPLESTALYLTYSALHQLVNHCPNNSFAPENVEKFNEKIGFSYNDCFGFIQMHYLMSGRDDSPFWIAQSNLKPCESYVKKMKQYRVGELMSSINSDSGAYYSNFDLEFSNFWTDGNYYSILTGMGVYPNQVNNFILNNPNKVMKAKEIFKQISKKESKLMKTLPSNYEFLKKFHAAHSQNQHII